MERSEATYQAFDGVPVTLPGGRVVRVAPLSVKEAVHYFRMLGKAEQGDAEAIYAFLEEFPARVEIQEETLSPAEVFEVARSFFHLRSWSPTAPEEGTPRTPTDTGSASMT